MFVKKTWLRLVTLFGCVATVFAFALVSAPTAFADTIAGGAAATISADTNSSDGTGVYTAISDLVITVDAIGDFADGDMITLTVPTGFAFEDDVNGVTATPSNEVDLGGGAATGVTLTATATTITIPVTTGNGITAAATITVSSLAVVPTAAGATLNTGNIAVVVTTGTFTDGNSAGTLTEVAGAFVQYSVTTQNSGTESVATPFTITVTPQDQFANTQTTSATNGNVVLTTNATTSPDSTNPVQDAGGTPATWSGLTVAMDLTTGAKTTTETFRLVDSSETPTITATESGATSCSAVACGGSSSAVTVTIGAASKLMIATQASTTVITNNAFGQQPVINITDAYGNTTTASTDTVSAAAFTDSSCGSAATGTLSNNTQAAVSGVATFSGMKYEPAATIYLGYTGGGLTAACSGQSSTIIAPASASSVVVSNGSQSGDDTPPAAPTNIKLVSADGLIFITWVDPTDSDLERIEILRGVGSLPVSGSVYAAVEPGIQTYIDNDVSIGDTVKYILRSKDSSDNTSNSSEYSILVSDKKGAIPAVPATPAVPGVSPAIPATPAIPASALKRYRNAGVTEEDVDSAAEAFLDLAKGKWHAPFIARMRKMAVLGGYPDGTIRPDQAINRAELAKIAAKSFGLANATEDFDDVPNGSWFAPFVGALQNSGAAWTSTANYRPGQNVSRGEALQTLLAAAGAELEDGEVEKLFPDVNTRHRFAKAISFAAKKGIVSGYENGNFGPGDTLTRGQVAKIVALIKDIDKPDSSDDDDE